LKRSRDPKKDQSYFLFSLRQAQLARVLMPVGEMTKAETRALAAQLGLKTHGKPDSQELCFVPENDYHAFLRDELGVRQHAGEIVDTRGRALGGHSGIEFFTIGQREGLGLGKRPLPRELQGKPLYVVALDAARNRVVVGAAEELTREEFIAERCNWISFDEPDGAFDAVVKIRSTDPGAPCTVEPIVESQTFQSDARGSDTSEGTQPTSATETTTVSVKTVRVRFHAPRRAVAPGQAAVFYDGDVVIGGGWIRE
jgi:tRNA-specific 2-thiouridylase